MIPSTSVQLSCLEYIQYNYNTAGLSKALFAVFCFSGKSRTISVAAARIYINTYPDSGLTTALKKITSRTVTHSPAGNLHVPVKSESLVNRGQLSEQQRLDQLRENMAKLEELATEYLEIVRNVAEIPLYTEIIAEELSAIDNGHSVPSAKKIISDVKSWSEALKLGSDNNVIDSSQTITDKLAAQALTQFRSRFNKLKFQPKAGEILKNLNHQVAGLMSDIRTNKQAYQNTKCISHAEDRVIATGEELKQLIDYGHDVLDRVLFMTQGNEDYQELKKKLDSRIQNILSMQS
ncbi:hypothetical protein [Endozoicomonas sp. GU-1]|uniref:hypothetical protein n=1 Tax=Endozoicomonas sp. GU-1 TaxID=3009078 RepID=UPI0022B31C06|nr:hypothetical protein [Endozoicomonas sp. GU-1]WBA82054.1 hypothetical protein O2T12_02470 [Endozoicomonas sp. GU-1]WBA85002.1 hypothetical protein O3276_17235 [Endozoicomonas sp. GU-1]